MEAVLTLKNKIENKEISIRLGQTIVIGRSPKAACRVLDDKISGNHCQLNFRFNCLEITDLNSKNGIYLNGVRIEKAQLYLGDEIKIGETIIKFNESMLDPQTQQLLTFKGASAERIQQVLKADYTRARFFDRKSPRVIAREMAPNNKPVNMKLSKEDILVKHRLAAGQARVIDNLALVIICTIPFILINLAINTDGIDLPGLRIQAETLRSNRYLFIGLGEVLVLAIFLTMNSKLWKYSLGERLSGIRDMHRKQ